MNVVLHARIEDSSKCTCEFLKDFLVYSGQQLKKQKLKKQDICASLMFWN